MPTRYDVEDALETSNLPAVSRHIIRVLCTRMQKGSIFIPPEYSPSLTRLARATGNNRRTIMRHLNALEGTGWLIRRRPPADEARAHYITTSYAVVYPQVEAGGPCLGTASPETVGTEDDGSRGPVPHNQIETDLRSDPEIEIVISELEKRTGRTIDPEWAAKTRDFILARPGVRNRKGYLRQVLAADPDPARFLPTSQPPSYKAPSKEGKS